LRGTAASTLPIATATHAAAATATAMHPPHRNDTLTSRRNGEFVAAPHGNSMTAARCRMTGSGGGLSSATRSIFLYRAQGRVHTALSHKRATLRPA
jgi:hypothetical protein